MKKFAVLLVALGLGTTWILFHARKNNAESATVALKGVASDGIRGDRTEASRRTDPRQRFSGSLARPLSYDETSALIDAICVALASDDLGIRDNAITNLLPALIGRDPVAAAGLAERIDVDEGREGLLRHVAQIWSGRDPAGALAWAGQLPEADERNAVLTDVALQIARTDPAEAVAVAEQHGLDDGTGNVLSVLMTQWAEKDPESALTWAGNQPAGERRNQCVARIAFVQSRSAPQEAANLVVREIPPGPVQDEAAISVLHQWMLQDFAGAAAWVAQFPESPLKERAGAELAGAERYLQAADASTAEDSAQ